MTARIGMLAEAERARAWLRRTYGDRVVLRDVEPVHVGHRMVLFGCGYLDDAEPMLAATVCVPRDGSAPFAVANADPLDEDLNLGGGADALRWRLNARNCVVTADAVLAERPACAMPWHPDDETPGWWDRMIGAHFPGAEITTCAGWDQAAKTIAEGGRGARAVVWLRRRLAGRELTGHLLYAEYGEDGVIFLDAQRGSPADTGDELADELVVARFAGGPGSKVAELVIPWDMAAVDLSAAVEKAERWLGDAYDEDVQLVSPGPEDELARGWLFAVTTKRFAETGDWREQMVDAALVVPKAAGQAPFGLPNRDPWTWLKDWDARVPGLPPRPDPGTAAWYAPMLAELGGARSVSAHRTWAGVLDEVQEFPVRTRTLVWVRRKDVRGRESVGQLLWAVTGDEGPRVVDPLAPDGEPLLDPNPLELRTIQIG
ncbi:YrhB domain-containing protein [Amycolatopsis sp. CA-230715]|uniref:YrhB domain-containing protein n=1 Tax=Amycolatopsis sp. CA-230715 TaxID=2745196 RepID=UPI001C33B761|nr:YrhB domain-containing protein [Amycolatopsis sp. CA-230715]QWF82761.1 hypothetical protein HUW46_06200 [Amycolatopsis sp. CA-230715]